MQSLPLLFFFFFFFDYVDAWDVQVLVSYYQETLTRFRRSLRDSLLVLSLRSKIREKKKSQDIILNSV
jgi:hypothetical protein